MTHTATVQRVDDERGVRAVVIQADPVIWIDDELMDYARDPRRERFTGDLVVHGDLISFGTKGEGLGRLVYRLVGRDEGNRCHIAEREQLHLHQETTPKETT